MSATVLLKLVGIFAVIGVGWLGGRTKLVPPAAAGVLGSAAFSLFTPALLFRTTAGIAVSRLPWTTLAAYFVPTLLILLATYGWQRTRRPSTPAGPAIRALSGSFSNTVQLGIPVVTALFGTAGLAILVAIISLQSLVLLTTGTVLAEVDLARADLSGERSGRALRVLGTTARRAVIHPVVLPVLLGLAYNTTGWPIPGPIDDVLATLGQAVVPVSLVTIGLTLQQYGMNGAVPRAAAQALGKLVLQPTVVLLVAYGVFGLRGLPLAVAVTCAALPIGSNVLLFANRYEVLQAETTAAIVTSTGAFGVTGTLWLLLLSHLI